LHCIAAQSDLRHHHLVALVAVAAGAFCACLGPPSLDPPGDGGPPDGAAADGVAWAGFKATTSAAQLTANNTSASSSWTGMVANGADGGGVNAHWDAPAGNVSKVPVSALLAGHDIPVWVASQNWWAPGSGHIDNGEDSTSSSQIAAQVSDQISRGFAGQIVDWYGAGTTADRALAFIKTNAEASGGKYQFAVMIDKGYFQNVCGETVACLNQAIDYIVSTYAGSSAYLKDSSGHPIIAFFVNQYYPTEFLTVSSSGIAYENTEFLMLEPNGFSGTAPPQTAGEYAWINPTDGTAGDSGFADLTSFFSNALNNQQSAIWSAVYKGFDDELASWGANRVIDQQCGRVWLETFQHSGSFGGSSSYMGSLDYVAQGGRLDAIMVDTWDDYEEGSEIETGIDNCLSNLKVSLVGSTLSWTPVWGADPMDASVTGTEATIYEYSIYVTPQGSTQLMWLADSPCSSTTCEHSIDVSKFGITGTAPYVFYVQAVGQPSIRNTLGGPTSTAYEGG
jgi:hypothetical protein